MCKEQMCVFLWHFSRDYRHKFPFCKAQVAGAGALFKSMKGYEETGNEVEFLVYLLYHFAMLCELGGYIRSLNTQTTR